MTIEAPAPIRLRTNIFRGCQRCHGTLRLERDLDSLLDDEAVAYVCLQCGRQTPLATIIARQQAAQEGSAA